ncbi:MAG: class I SAM-dependent methyltransferase [Pseudomonadota bacterium]
MSMLSGVAPWDMVAEGYAETTKHWFRPYIEAALDLVPLTNNDQIADIACGPGTLSLAAAGRVASVKALDFSENMLAMLRESIAEEGVDNIEAVQGDGQDLPYEDGTFDAAFSMFGLMFFPDRSKGYAELRRTLKPGGHVCVASWAPVAHSPVMTAMFGAMQAIKPDLPDPTYDATSLENPDVLKAELSAAGFRDVSVHHVTLSSEITSAEDFWAGMVKGSAPVLMLKNATPEEVWREKSKRAVDHIETEVGPLPVTLSATAYVGVGVK